MIQSSQADILICGKVLHAINTSRLNRSCQLILLLCLPGEALQLVGTVVDMECCYLTAEVFRTILLAGSPAAAGTAQVRAQLHRPGYCSHTPFQ